MKNRPIPMISGLLTLMACTVTTMGQPPPSAATSPVLVGYYYGLDHHNHIADIPSTGLRSVLYAFVNVSSAGECVSEDSNSQTEQANFTGLRQLKRQQPALKTLISVGGYGLSTYFSDAALTSDTRRHFARTCVAGARSHSISVCGPLSTLSPFSRSVR